LYDVSVESTFALFIGAFVPNMKVLAENMAAFSSNMTGVRLFMPPSGRTCLRSVCPFGR
jgi:hypothetical protein